MIRVEHELSRASYDQWPRFEPVFYSPATKSFHGFNPAWVDDILSWNGIIDTWQLDFQLDRTGWRRWVPSRYPIIKRLEIERLRSPSRIVRKACDWLQRGLLSVRRHKFPLTTADGQRVAVVPSEAVLSEVISLDEDDVILSPASDWPYKDLDLLSKAKQESGFKYVTICYDIIPILYPEYFPAADTKIFTAYWRRMFALADLVIVNSKAVRDDVVRYCRDQSIAAPNLSVVPLGTDKPRDGRRASLPGGLKPECFILFVSTIEPRKNHRLLLQVWRDLLARGIPQASDFKLVFVGRRGWMVDEVLSEIDDVERWQGSLVHLTRVDDAMLETLYHHAAFCVYPSFYEGFGLPVIEAVGRGKAVILSNGGALKEFGHLGVSLSPRDLDGWTNAFEAWITNPAARAASSANAANEFEYAEWSQVAAEMLKAAERAGSTKRQPALD